MNIDFDKLKKVSVLGMGRSGLEVAKFFKDRGISVFVSDSASADKLKNITDVLDGLSIEYEAGRHSDKVWDGTDLVVISPGIPLHIPIVKLIKGKSIPIISELELAYNVSKAPFIAITGTNGKSTTTTMIGEFLTAFGVGVVLGGNIGVPLVKKVYNAGKDDVIVAEVSSFQLETTRNFNPSISLILNISSDHLNRHGTMENYLSLKSRIFENHSKGDKLILNYDDPAIRELSDKAKGEVYFFSSRSSVEKGIYSDGNKIFYKNGISESTVCDVKDIPLPGEHNLQNTMAAMLAALLYGAGEDVLRDSLLKFKGLKHRMEYVETVKDVTFIDDSKGTNPDAVIAAINSFKEPLILIAGGVDKDMDFSELCRVIASRVKGLVLIGTTAERLEKLCRENGLSHILRANSIDDAVGKSFSMAEPGDTVLLSPAGASFDMFKNAEDRGDKFVQAVFKLAKEIK